MKAKGTIKGRNRTRTKNKGNEGSIASFMERTKGISLGNVHMPRKPKRG
jgi:hypothetical protein